MYVSDQDGVARLIEMIRPAAMIAIDTEFMREKTYFARLCLVQVATEDVVAVVDPLAANDIRPLLEFLADSPAPKVLHAGSQDLEIFYHATGRVPSPVFDTQVAATLVGFPTQIGYGQLVREMLGVELSKADTFTDWSVRPLSDQQIAYAADDVRYLPEICARMRAELEAEGRLGWLAEDFERLADPATYEADPLSLYRRVKRASTLDRRGLALLRELAAWREGEAQRRDLPRRWIIGDESLVEIARRAPRSRGDLAVRGAAERTLERSADAILAAVERGLSLADDELPRLPKRQRHGAQTHQVADVLSAVLRLRAKEHGVAPTLLATRDELERFAAGEREGHPLSSGWRHVLVGAEFEALLDGRLSLAVEDGRVVISPRAAS